MRTPLRTKVLGEKSVCVCVLHFHQKSHLNLPGVEKLPPPHFFDISVNKHVTHVAARKLLFYDENSKANNKIIY